MVPLDVDRALTGERWHISSEVLVPLCDAISAICRSKHDVLMFFKGCRVPHDLMADLVSQVESDRDSIYKHEIAERVIERLNEHGDSVLRVRREVVRQVVEFEDFSRCWPTGQDRARGLVAKVREIVGQKDAFTRMAQERDREAVERRKVNRDALEAENLKREAIRKRKGELAQLFGKIDPYERARLFEKILNNLCKDNGILVREDFIRRNFDEESAIEQIDGVIEFDGNIYLTEAKWWKSPLGRGEVSSHLVRVYNRGEARGLFISASGYTAAAVSDCVDALVQKVVVLCTLEEIYHALDAEIDFVEFLRKKVRAVMLQKDPCAKVFPA